MLSTLEPSLQHPRLMQPITSCYIHPRAPHYHITTPSHLDFPCMHKAVGSISGTTLSRPLQPMHTTQPKQLLPMVLGVQITDPSAATAALGRRPSSTHGPLAGLCVVLLPVPIKPGASTTHLRLLSLYSTEGWRGGSVS